MDYDFSEVERGETVVVRLPHGAGILLESGRYWFFPGKVQRKHRNGDIIVLYTDRAGKQVVSRYNRQGHHIPPGQLVEPRSLNRLVPMNPTIDRIFRYQKVFSTLWRLTWADLMLLQDYELEHLAALFSSISTRSALAQLTPEQERQALQEAANYRILCVWVDAFHLLERFPFCTGDLISIEERRIKSEGNHTGSAALLLHFIFEGGAMNAQQEECLRDFARHATIYAMGKPGAIQDQLRALELAEGT